MDRRSTRRRRADDRQDHVRRAQLVDEGEQSHAELEANTSFHIQVIVSEDSDPDDNEPITRKRSRVDLFKEESEEPEEAGLPAQDEDTEQICTICFESFTSSGTHRLVSLKCGHFFGEDCIKRWISSENGRSCPQCKKTAKLKDLRNHFAASVKTVDNSEAESLRQSVIAFQRENEGLRLQNLSLKKQIELLKKNSVAIGAQVVKALYSSFNLQRKHVFVLSKEEGSRAFDLNGERIVVAVKLASSPISDGFGIAVLDSNLRQIGEKVVIASRRIRTIEFCPYDAALYLVGGEDAWLLVRSVDGGVRKRVAVPAPVWSSCWTSASKVAVGLSNGRVMELDTDQMVLSDLIPWDSRIGITQIARFEKLFALVIVSLKSILVLRHGRISSHLQEEIGSHGKIHDLSVLPTHNSFVLSFQTTEGSTHKLYRMHVDEDENVEMIFVSQCATSSKSFSYMWRNSLFHFDGVLNSAFFQEDFKRVMIHDWSGHKEDRFLTMGASKITQMRFVSSGSQPEVSHILALSEKELHLLQLGLVK